MKEMRSRLASVLASHSVFDRQNELEEALEVVCSTSPTIQGGFVYGSASAGPVNDGSDLDVFLLDRNRDYHFSTHLVGRRWISVCTATSAAVHRDVTAYEYGHVLATRFVNPVLCFGGDDVMVHLARSVRGGLLLEAMKSHALAMAAGNVSSTHSIYDTLIIHLRFQVSQNLYYLYPLSQLLADPKRTVRFVMEYREAIGALSKSLLSVLPDDNVSIHWAQLLGTDSRYKHAVKLYKAQVLSWSLYRDSRQLDSIKRTVEAKGAKLLKCQELFDVLFSASPMITSLSDALDANK